MLEKPHVSQRMLLWCWAERVLQSQEKLLPPLRQEKWVGARKLYLRRSRRLLVDEGSVGEMGRKGVHK